MIDMENETPERQTFGSEGHGDSHGTNISRYARNFL